MAKTGFRRKYINTTVDVEISLSQIETEDLIEELKSRGEYFATDVGLEDIYKQFAFNNNDRAVELTKRYIEQNLGRTLQ
jgi:hypothetical protein